jgi:hypothetical protein
MRNYPLYGAGSAFSRLIDRALRMIRARDVAS